MRQQPGLLGQGDIEFHAGRVGWIHIHGWPGGQSTFLGVNFVPVIANPTHLVGVEVEPESEPATEAPVEPVEAESETKMGDEVAVEAGEE